MHFDLQAKILQAKKCMATSSLSRVMERSAITEPSRPRPRREEAISKRGKCLSNTLDDKEEEIIEKKRIEKETVTELEGTP